MGVSILSSGHPSERDRFGIQSRSNPGALGRCRVYRLIFHCLPNGPLSGAGKKVIWVWVLSTAFWALAGMIYQFIILKKDFFVPLKFFSLGI